MVLIDKGLHYLRVKGLATLPQIPGMRASGPHLLLTASLLGLFRNGNSLCTYTTPGTERL